MCIQVVDGSSSVFPWRCGSGSQASVKYFRDTRTKSDASLCSPTQQTTWGCCPGPSTIPWRWNSRTLCTFNGSVKPSCEQSVLFLAVRCGTSRAERNCKTWTLIREPFCPVTSHQTDVFLRPPLLTRPLRFNACTLMSWDTYLYLQWHDLLHISVFCHIFPTAHLRHINKDALLRVIKVCPLRRWDLTVGMNQKAAGQSVLHTFQSGCISHCCRPTHSAGWLQPSWPPSLSESSFCQFTSWLSPDFDYKGLVSFLWMQSFLSHHPWRS